MGAPWVSWRSPARARAPNPPDARWSHSRRETVFMALLRFALIDIEEGVGGEEHAGD